MLIYRYSGDLDGLLDELAKLIRTTKGRSFAAIIVSAMTLLTFMSEQKRTVMGIGLNADEGWAEIGSALKNIFLGRYLFTQERLASDTQTSPVSAEETP